VSAVKPDYYAAWVSSDAYRAERAHKAEVILHLCRAVLERATRIGDVGCGTGLVKEALEAALGKPIVGFEIDVSFVEVGERVVAADACRLPISDGGFDVLILNHLYEHVRDQAGLFREAWRVLRPGGVAYVAAGSRRAVLEPHYQLPFLSWLPRGLADRYVRWTGRGKEYRDIRFLTYAKLERLMAAGLGPDLSSALLVPTRSLAGGLPAVVLHAHSTDDRGGPGSGGREGGGMTSGARTDRLVTWLFLGGAALVSLLFYRDFILHPDRLLFGTDMIGEGFPLRRFAVDELRAGRGIPLWTPYVYGGMPYVALLPGPLFYPSSLLYLVMPLYRAIGWTFVLHTFLAGGFGYFLARSFRLRPSAAAVCGTSFMLTGYVMSHLYGGHDGRIFAMVLFPLALGSLERALRTADVRWWALLAGAVGLQILTPHTQLMYFSSLALGLYLVFHLTARARRGEVREYARPVAGFVAAFALAAGLGAAQLLPTLGLLDHVVRAASERGYEFAASWALPPQEISALVLPDLIGSLPENYWGRNPFKLHIEYMGVIPVALAMLALVGSFAPRDGTQERRVVWFLAGVTLVGLLFALGGATPVHRLAYAIVPMMKSFRAPAMMMGVVAALVALLAGFGWQTVLAARRTGSGKHDPPGVGVLRPRVAIVLLSAPFLLLGLAAALSPAGLLDFAYHAWFPEGWPRRPSSELEEALRTGGLFLVGGWVLTLGVAEAVARRRVGGATVLVLLLFTVADLWRIDARYVRTVPAAEVLRRDPVVDRLAERLEPGQRAWALEGFRPNDFLYFRIPTPDGSQKFLLRWSASLLGGIRPAEGLAGRPVPLWALFDVRYLVARSGLESPLLEELPGGGLYAVRDTVPHAYFPERVELAADTADALRRTLAIESPVRETILERVQGAGFSDDGRVPQAGAGTASVVRYEPDEIVLEVEAERAGLLVVSEIWHPGWQARIDGVETPVWRANTAFRAVEVPMGEHEVGFRYESPAYRIGSVTSGLSLVLLLGLLVGPTLSRRRRWGAHASSGSDPEGTSDGSDGP
jgi:SAM-dependent methyltransferase